MKERAWAHLLLAGLGLAAGAGQASAQVLTVVSQAPARAHLVAAGTATTFVVSARNRLLVPRTVSVSIQSAPAAAGGWQALLFSADQLFRPVGAGSDRVSLVLGAGESVHLVARLTADASLAEGAEGTAVVTATVPGGAPRTVELKARVHNRAKVYYVAVDGCAPGYLDLDRKGAPYNGSRERLMPRISSWLSKAALMTKGTALFPTTTDGNHAAALTGSWPGTLGLFSVKHHYLGRDAQGNAVTQVGSRELLRWGPDGQPIQTIFEVAKDPQAGGTSGAFTVLASGKRWLGWLFEGGSLDLAVGGSDHPAYIPAPKPFRLGDPPSDEDPEQDREGTNLGTPETMKIYSAQAQALGRIPLQAPSDRWTAEAVARIIAAEDPDVVYTDLAECDTAQHIFGGANRPEEWIDPGTPEILWDDENIYNRSANRDPVLDVVHEADANFGLITDLLESRQTLGRSLVVLLSDHGGSTMMKGARNLLDVGHILELAGIGPADVERITAFGEIGWIAVSDPAKSPQIEAILEAHQRMHPVLEMQVNPLIVINRQEMDSGIDNVEGPLWQDGTGGNRRGELYSEWSIDGPSTDLPRVRWPDLFFFTRHHFQNELIRSDFVTNTRLGTPFVGHHGSRNTADVLLAMSGPGLQVGRFDSPASLADIAPTLYRLLGLARPAHVDGKVLDPILQSP